MAVETKTTALPSPLIIGSSALSFATAPPAIRLTSVVVFAAMSRT